MFSVIKLDMNYPLGTCVTHNGDDGNVWTQGGGATFGVVESSCEPDPDGAHYWARIRIAGQALAIADTDIPSEGGMLAVNPSSGRVYVSTTESCGIICPNSRYQTEVAAGELVTIYIR